MENEAKPIAAANGQNGENGHHSVVNGTTNGTNGDAAIKPNDVANKEIGAANIIGGGKMKEEEKASSSNLKCLEDPNFSFDEVPSSSSSSSHPASNSTTANLAVSESKGSTEAGGSAGKKPSYR